ncbi:MAG: Hpt domain-containing protein [Actinomycetota bacterium]|nr:Hpt domain-containing protein [Actinomycetota bacterium]
MEELADTVIEGAPVQIAALTGAAARSDVDTVARAAHQLKGSCAAVGARSMEGLAGQIEAAAVENHPERPPATVAQLEQSFESAVGPSGPRPGGRCPSVTDPAAELITPVQALF